MEALIYYDEGDSYMGHHKMTRKEILDFKERAKGLGHTGYLIGRTWRVGTPDDTATCVCFFHKKPTQDEINKRVENGFIGATWHSIDQL